MTAPTTPHPQAVLHALAAMRALIEDVPDLPAVLDAASRSLDTAVFFDPTLWRDKHEDLEHDIRVLKAVLPAWQLARDIRDGAATARR